MTDLVRSSSVSAPCHTHCIEVGVVGLGLMGRSIVIALLLAGHKVVAVAPLPIDCSQIQENFRQALKECEISGRLQKGISAYEADLVVTESYGKLENCSLVVECVIEDLAVKQKVYKEITQVVRTDTVIGTNTSAIPISILQKYVEFPERFLGIHWAEPAYLTRFLEVICGEQTSLVLAEWVTELASYWGKEPTLLRRDIRGFITNRLMYAVYRELFHILEQENASYESLDKALRYDAGSWMTLMGIFRRADLQGATHFLQTLDNLFPKLNKMHTVPSIMQNVVAEHKRGIYNLEGIYSYTAEESQLWEENFNQFSDEINRIATVYSTKNIELFLHKTDK